MCSALNWTRLGARYLLFLPRFLGSQACAPTSKLRRDIYHIRVDIVSISGRDALLCHDAGSSKAEHSRYAWIVLTRAHISMNMHVDAVSMLCDFYECFQGFINFSFLSVTTVARKDYFLTHE